MNIAIILAGGRGQRMGSDVPKQFMEVNGLPIIMYTLDVFMQHPLIDAIIVVCLKSWTEELWTMLRKHGADKVVRIVEGGANVQESTYNGLCAAKDWMDGKTDEECMVVIHDSVRPLINDDLITRNIETARIHGNSITVAPPTDTYVVGENDDHRLLPREQVHIVRAPQVFRLKDIIRLHEQVMTDGKQGYSDCCSLLCEYGIPFHKTIGDSCNIKITYPADITLFRSLMQGEKR